MRETQSKYMPYSKAQKLVQSLGIKTAKEFQQWAAGHHKLEFSRPADLPSNPHQVYPSSQWKGFGDFLGTKRVANYNRKFLPFEEAREFVHHLGLCTIAEWRSYLAGEMPWLPERPLTIPTNPNYTYKEHGWDGYGDWLGNGRSKNVGYQSPFWPYAKAQEFVSDLSLSGYLEWRTYVKGKMAIKKPPFIPSVPHACYKDEGWISYGNWLGTENSANFNKGFLPFKRARELVRSFRCDTKQDYLNFLNECLPEGLKGKIPRNPDRTYQNSGWEGYGDYLGNDRSNYIYRRRKN